MQLQKKLQEGVLLKRYKRFLADITTQAGESITIHCPNTGSMKNCQEPGSRIWYSDSENPNRKYACTWELVEVDNKHIVGINTGLANKLVHEAITSNRIIELTTYESIRTEVAYGEQKSRIDLLLEGTAKDPDALCYVEVKNVSLGLGDGLGSFPDAVTTRGQKHLQELLHMHSLGHRAVLLFCVQHSGIRRIIPADNIDPEYGRLLREVASKGVEVIAYRADFDVQNSRVMLREKVPVLLS
jgi:sugar fermentation stimulation protein A|tara:strand:- start:289 stop:1014 length:726 start_codon:yes stop_codon:yes gene_type:complete